MIIFINLIYFYARKRIINADRIVYNMYLIEIINKYIFLDNYFIERIN